MKQLLALSFLFTLLSLTCNKEQIVPQLPSQPESEIPENQKFELSFDLTSGYENQFIIVSDREGTIVFDTMVTRFSGMKKINAFANEELYVTHGRQSGDSFLAIDTYTNVRSGFTIKDDQGICDNDLLIRRAPIHQINLTIKNTPLIDSIYLPFRTPFNSPPQVDLNNHQIMIEGSLANDENYLITLKTNSSIPTFKSYLLNFDELPINDPTEP